jgi:hypothetical protein
MPTEIRVNQIQNRSGLSTVTFSDTGVVIAGVTNGRYFGVRLETLWFLESLTVTGSISGNDER